MAPTFLYPLAVLALTSSFSYASPQVYHELHKRALVTPNNLPTGWSCQGCYNDSAANRALTGDYYADGSKMTDEACIAYCSGKHYAIAGTEYSQECFCSNVIGGGSVQAPVGDCNMGCSGNSSEACGGPNRLTVFENPSLIPVHDPGPNGWTFIGCYTDSGTRALSSNPATPGGQGAMTVAICAATCAQSNSKYAGMEYAGECYCGNSFLGGNGPAPDGLSGCNMLCSGNSSEFCGGPYRLDMYQAPGTGAQPISSSSSSKPSSTVVSSSTSPATTSAAASTTSAAATTSSAPATTSSAPATTSSAPATTTSAASKTTASSSASKTSAASTTSASSTASGLPSGWAYKGCYIDNAHGRDLPYQLPDNSSLTVESCVQNCYGQGYSVAGMEYSRECYCGNAIYSGGALASSDTDCNMPCGGNAKENCGAGNRLSVYSNGTITTYQPAVPQTSDLPGSWTYDGCYNEASTTGKVFKYQIINTKNNSATSCLSLCSQYGYPVAGMEYGDECYCGDPSDVTNAGSTKQSDAVCNMACSGDPRYLCGAGNLLSLYRWTGTPLYTWHTPTGSAAGQYQLLIGGVVVPLITSQTVTGKVTFLEKHGTSLAANSTGAFELDVTKVNDFSSAWRTMNGLKTDVFCSAGLTLPDKGGRQINIGGWSLTSTFGVRLYWPGGPTNDWQENVNELTLQNGRWYPSAMQMTNGSILVVGGESGSNGPPVPTLEILPNPVGGQVITLDFLNRTDPYNLYPFMAVLPSGGIFIAYYNEARILDERTFATTKQLPNIPGAVNNFEAGRTYPLEGTAVLMPQYAPYTDPLGILICGGSTPYAGIALDNCVSTQPEAATPKWTLERMPSQRVMPCIATLPDGTYLILNGAHQGAAGFGLASSPNLNALLYDPSQPSGSRISIMANTIVARLYHSEAILLSDGRVMVSGSDPEDNVNPEEYRVEVFMPPYLLSGLPQPTFNLTSKDWTYGASIPLTITKGSTTSLRVSLLGAESSTHGNSMGQRILFPAVSCTGTTCSVTAPPNAHVCPPGWYQLFVLDGPTPSHSVYVRIGGDPASLGKWPNYGDFDLPGV